MSAEEWEKVKQVFEQALNMRQSRRSAFLDMACEGAPDMRNTVAELLSAHNAAGSGFMTRVCAPPPANLVFSQGQLVAGRFRIVRLLGRGGMGEVYEAFDEKLQLRIALKTLRPELARDIDALGRFQREICIARQVTHRSLCPIYDLAEHHSEDDPSEIIPCLSMQLLTGESLHSYLDRARPLSPQTALPLIKQIAEALDVLHDHGIVHRDLKPENIMVVPGTHSGPHIVVTDFGLAKPLNSSNEQFESQFGFKAGSPYFMAPELLSGGPPTFETDLYAFGLVVDEMVTSTRAFPTVASDELLYQRLRQSPIAPSSRAPDLSPQWDRAILRCLAPGPGDRYRRASEAVSDLDESRTDTISRVPSSVTKLAGIWDVARRWVTQALGRLIVRRSLIYSVLILLITGILSLSAYVSRPLNTSVVVFPLENLTARPQYDYLCKGTAFELTNRLANVKGIRVIPYYEPRSQASRILSQGAFSISGYLQNSHETVRLGLQLTDNRDGALVWADEFDRNLSDQLQLQLEIAERTVQAIETRVLFGHQGRDAVILSPLRRAFGFQKGIEHSVTNSSAALDLYMRGRFQWDARTPTATVEAVQLFKQALDEDPQFALAWAALSEAQFVLMDYRYGSPSELMAKAREYAEHAIAAGPELADGYVTLAAVDQMELDWQGAEVNYLKAINLNPKHARARRWYAGLLIQFKRFDEAIQQAQEAIAIDPYEDSHRAGYGLYLYYAGRYSEAVAELEHLLAQKDVLAAHICLGYAYAALAARSSGTEASTWFDKAFHEADLVRKVELTQPVLTYSGPMFGLFTALRGENAKAQEYLRDLLPAVATGKISPVPIAQIFVALGDGAQAMSLLELAAQNKDRELQYINVSPFFANLRQSDRFQSLLKSLRL